jgi:hypothetical protein
MVTARAISDDVINLLDYLRNAGIAAYTTTVAVATSSLGDHVGWYSYKPGVPFLVTRGDPSLDDYCAWVDSGSYSALLFDGALLQVNYEIERGNVSAHRLAYVPCPYRLDPEMVRQDPILDLIELYMENEPTNMILHSPVRFDFDPKSAGEGHPSAHMTINSKDCRIACMAPMHVRRFADFIFRHFYAAIWKANAVYFNEGACREIGPRSIIEGDRVAPHIAWTLPIQGARA